MKSGSKAARITALLDLSDGEHTVNGKTFTKSDNVFTLDGQKLAARDIEKATRTLNEKLKGSEQTYTPQTETQPEQKPTTSDKMQEKGKKADTAKPSEVSEVSEKSDQSGNTILFSKTGDVEGKSAPKNYREKEVTVQFSSKNHSQKVDFLKNGEAIPVKKDNIHLKKGTGKSATQQVVDQIENFSSQTYSTEIGNVDIDEQSIADSMGHGYGQEKLDVFAVLQKGFQNAVYIGNAPDWDGNDLINHYFAFPIMYNGERNLVFCRVRSDVNKTRLYVHEVYLESNIDKTAGMFQTAAEQDKTLKPHEHSSLYKNILSYFYIASGDFKKTFKIFVQINPSSAKNPEKSSSGGIKFSMSTDLTSTEQDGGIKFSKPADIDPNATQEQTAERIDRESENLTDPELTAERYTGSLECQRSVVEKFSACSRSCVPAETALRASVFCLRQTGMS